MLVKEYRICMPLTVDEVSNFSHVCVEHLSALVCMKVNMYGLCTFIILC